MRILHIVQRYWPASGGAERHLHEIGRRLVRDGHAVTVYTTDADDFQLFWDRRKRRLDRLSDVVDGIEVQRFRVHHVPGDPLAFPVIRRLMYHLSALPWETTSLLRRVGQFTPWVPGLGRALVEAGPAWDMAAGMTITYDSLLWSGAEWAEQHGRPWLVYPLTHLGEGPRSSMRRYYTMRHQLDLSRRAQWVFAQTEAERRFLISQGVTPDRIIVAGVGINPVEYGAGDAARIRDRLNIPPDTFLILSLGTASRDKGALDTLQAVQRLPEGADWRLIFAGAAQDDFRRVFERLPEATRRRAHWLGSVSEQDKQDLLAAADVVCLPSRADSFGIVYLEAWMYGKPVIGAQIEGVADVISEGETGLLVPFGDSAALAEALACLRADPARRRSMGARGRARVLARYTWDAVYDRVRPAYAESGARSV